jgi:aspartyl protease family protein
MEMSSGPQRAIAEAVSWALACSFFAFMLVYNKEVRVGLGFAVNPAAVIEQAAPAANEPAKQQPQTVSTSTATFSDTTERLVADGQGHFNASANINGSPINVLVDTGATMVALTWDDARAAGIHMSESDFTMRSQTANGIAYFAPAKLSSVRIGNITVYNVRAAVAKPGQLSKTLLGMTFLSQVRMESRDRELILSR